MTFYVHLYKDGLVHIGTDPTLAGGLYITSTNKRDEVLKKLEPLMNDDNIIPLPHRNADEHRKALFSTLSNANLMPPQEHLWVNYISLRYSVASFIRASKLVGGNNPYADELFANALHNLKEELEK